MGAEEVRRVAARVRQIGDDVRRLADQTSAAPADQWRSTAAEGFRRRLAEEAGRVRSVAVKLDDASDALFQHAFAIESAFRVGIFGDGR